MPKVIPLQIKRAVSDSDGRVLRGQATRAKIVRAARDIINESGRPPLAREVHERAEVALRTIYHHFPNMEELTRHALALHPRKRLTIVYQPAEKTGR